MSSYREVDGCHVVEMNAGCLSVQWWVSLDEYIGWHITEFVQVPMKTYFGDRLKELGR